MRGACGEVPASVAALRWARADPCERTGVAQALKGCACMRPHAGVQHVQGAACSDKCVPQSAALQLACGVAQLSMAAAQDLKSVSHMQTLQY